MDFYLKGSEEYLAVEKKDIICLALTSWDDWYAYSTQYIIYYFNENSDMIQLGSIKIGRFNMGSYERTPDLPPKFKTLSNDFFSIGQDVRYYETLNAFGGNFRHEILDALNDIALKSDLYELALAENVTKHSLLRSVSITSIEGQFRRLAQGIIELTKYDFKFVFPNHLKSNTQPVTLEFNVIPESSPPSNIHVIIGRNGVGKTYLFNNMIECLTNENIDTNKSGYFESFEINTDKLFANLVFVSFSAFDETNLINEKKDKTKNIKYSYIGLKKKDGKEVISKSPIMLKNEFVKSVVQCVLGDKNERWLRSLKMLETDPIFKEAEISNIAKLKVDEEFKLTASNVFNRLSSGHKIVLITITRLVETLEERSLVLLDEPETYLHPPLLSAFTRALSTLLITRNAVAIVGTHSPVILQEVPRSCVWKLRRHGNNAIAERLDIESFGENVGLLTQEVFGLEVTDSGFHRLLDEVSKRTESYEEAIKIFNNQLGFEAKAILRNIFHKKSLNNEKDR